MRKYRKHKVYDTSTSEYLCPTPFGNLYRKNSSLSFFLVSRNEQVITPTSWNEAEQLVQEYGTKMQFDKIFRPESVTNKAKAKERITTAMSREDYSKLRILSGRRGVSIGQYIHLTINERFRQSEFRKSKQQINK